MLRLKALHNSTTIEEVKQKYEKVLKVDFMSSDESVTQDSDNNLSNRDERRPPVKVKG